MNHCSDDSIQSTSISQPQRISSQVAPSGESHSFDLALACEYGVEAAILIRHLQFWIRHNKKKQKNFINGRTWTFQTLKEITDHLPYLKKDKVNRVMFYLVERKVIRVGHFHEKASNRTNWYAFEDEPLFVPELSTNAVNPSHFSNCEMDFSNCEMYIDKDSKQKDKAAAAAIEVPKKKHNYQDELIQILKVKLGLRMKEIADLQAKYTESEILGCYQIYNRRSKAKSGTGSHIDDPARYFLSLVINLKEDAKEEEY